MSSDVLRAEVAEEWLAVGLASVPADRAEAEAGVAEAYAAAGLSAPEMVLWLDSPEAGCLAVAALSSGSTGGDERIVETLRKQGVHPGGTPLGASVRPAVRTRPWAQARAALLADLGGVGFARHWAATARRPWQQLVDQLATPLRTRLDASLTREGGLAEPARHALLDVILGQHDAAWLGAFAGAAHGSASTPELAGLARIARSAGWWWAFDNVAVLTERPTVIHRDNLGRLHHGDGPALSYPDGYGLHAWRGMPIPAEVAAELPTLTFERLQAETNAEVRRVMLEHFGFDRYLRESGAVKAHVDDFGTLWKVDIPGDEPLAMVEVVNGSPEPDGTFRTYFLRVPPTVQTAREGVAWTFDLTEQDYLPLQQT